MRVRARQRRVGAGLGRAARRAVRTEAQGAARGFEGAAGSQQNFRNRRAR